MQSVKIFTPTHFKLNIIMIDPKTEQDMLWEALSIFDNYQTSPTTLPNEIETIEIDRIKSALSAFEGNKTRAAKSLGIGRTNLIAKIKKYDLRHFES
tara:strand:- start:17163 stop:17453 length:291 start_codon:yes stop_codon:yes gene_type:complete